MCRRATGRYKFPQQIYFQIISLALRRRGNREKITSSVGVPSTPTKSDRSEINKCFCLCEVRVDFELPRYFIAPIIENAPYINHNELEPITNTYGLKLTPHLNARTFETNLWSLGVQGRRSAVTLLGRFKSFVRFNVMCFCSPISQ